MNISLLMLPLPKSNAVHIASAHIGSHAQVGVAEARQHEHSIGVASAVANDGLAAAGLPRSGRSAPHRGWWRRPRASASRSRLRPWHWRPQRRDPASVFARSASTLARAVCPSPSLVTRFHGIMVCLVPSGAVTSMVCRITGQQCLESITLLLICPQVAFSRQANSGWNPKGRDDLVGFARGSGATV